MFPSTIPVLDSFDRADGPLGPNWIDAVDGVAQGLTIVGRRATGSVNAAFNESAWATGGSPLTAVYVLVPVLPGAANRTIDTIMLSNTAGTSVIRLRVNPTTPSLTLTTAGSVSSSLDHFAAGDGIAVSYDPLTQIAAGWYWDGTTIGPWQQINTRAAATTAPQGTDGWLAALGVVDTTTMLESFGAETMPFGDQIPMIGVGSC